MRADLVLQLGQRRTQAHHHYSTRGRDSIPARVTRPLGFGCTQPSSVSHSRQQRVQRARTQTITVPSQLLQHPLSVHALLFRMMQDMDFPESK
jgi:hypothetical protein